LIVFDTARADSFEPYGAPARSTPTVAQLADEGTAHPKAFAPSSWTIPSHVSMFTGLMPRDAGLHLVQQTHEGFRQVMDHFQDRLLPSVLSRLGYRTIGISANAWVSPPAGFDIGFDEFHHVTSGRHTRLGEDRLVARLRWARDSLRANLDDGALTIERLVEQAMSDPAPFFCFVNLVECHSPYMPPRPFNQLGWRDRLRAAHDANQYCTFEAFWNIALGVSPPPPADALDRMRTLYQCSIHQLDSWLARILDALDRFGIRDQTQLIVTSDHGENFGEGGLTGHTFSLDDRLIRVPFISSGPLDLRTPGAMSLADLPAVLADSLEIDDHPWGTVDESREAVVAQFPAPVRRDDPRLEEGLRRWPMGEAAQRTLLRTFDCATDGRMKLFRDEDGETAVDLARDPDEVSPTAPESPDGSLLVLRRLLDGADRSAMRATPWSASAASETEEDAALAEQMRLLGYL
jgi:arylsulfatase A-like enzyme